MTTDLILGTAGHIDHGKTSLVKALTGTDTDRLPEEKRRGITIDLGFAELTLGSYRLGIVDVPGHERFVRNMLAGATGIDLGLLVIAADDSVKPQTREHLEILRLLGLRHGVIALTKCDLPEPEWIDLVEQEVREFVGGTFLARAPLVRTSSTTGEGLEALRAALTAAAAAAAAEPRPGRQGPFRMPVDRVFTIAGHGTVVTGSVLSGSVAVGGELAVEPGAIAVRVRGLENHGRPIGEVHAGQRAAINLAGVHHGELVRGQELCASGYLRPSRRLSVRLEALRGAARPLRHRQRLRLHLGTADVLASLVLLDRDQLDRGQSALGQLLLEHPVVATWGQAFVLRSPSPVVTVGGGQVLDPDAGRIRRRQEEPLARLADLASDDPETRVAAAIYFSGFRASSSGDLSRSTGVDQPQPLVESLVAVGVLRELSLGPGKTQRVHRHTVEHLVERVESLLKKLHQQQPLATGFERSGLVRPLGMEGAPAVLDAVLEQAIAEGRFRASGRTVALADAGPKLSARQRALLDEIVRLFDAAGFQPPSPSELQSRLGATAGAIGELLRLASENGMLVRIAADLYLHAGHEQRLRQLVTDRLQDGSRLTVSEFRELLGTSRKFAVPICEYLDRSGVTRREGDLRRLRT